MLIEVEMTGLKGSTACPICGQDTPHHHETVAIIIADCRAKSKHYRTRYGSGETMSVSAVAAFFDNIAERLERTTTAIAPSQEEIGRMTIDEIADAIEASPVPSAERK